MSLLDGGNAPAPAQTQNNQPPASQEPVQVPEWLKGVEESLLNEPSVKIQKDINSLVKSYVSAQKAIGADKVVLPKKDATPEQWNDLFKKLGLPESEDKYGIQKGDKSTLDDEFFSSFKKSAFEAGLLPHQAQRLLSSFEGIAQTNTEKMVNAVKEISEQQIATLKAEWGEAYDSKLEVIKETVDRFGGDELRGVLKQAGLASHPTIAKLFVELGESLREKSPKGIEPRTPAEVSKTIEDIMSDRNHPYHNASHIDHAKAVREVEVLFQKQFAK